jgi:hypothetical protein
MMGKNLLVRGGKIRWLFLCSASAFFSLAQAFDAWVPGGGFFSFLAAFRRRPPGNSSDVVAVHDGPVNGADKNRFGRPFSQA